MPGGGPRAGIGTSVEIRGEIARVLREVERYNATMPDRFHEAFRLADIDARRRDIDRFRLYEAEGGNVADFQWGPGLVALHLSHWLVARADRATPAESLAAAIAAAEATEATEELARDLHEFVAGYLDGSISDEEFTRRLKMPRAPRRSRSTRQLRGAPATDITVGTALTRLRTMLADAGLALADEVDAVPDPRRVWDVFKSFAAMSSSAEPPDRLDADDMLFEWMIDSSPHGEASGRVLVELGRQFTIYDGDDDYDHMEQPAWANTRSDPTAPHVRVAQGALRNSLLRLRRDARANEPCPTRSSWARHSTSVRSQDGSEGIAEAPLLLLRRHDPCLLRRTRRQRHRAGGAEPAAHLYRRRRPGSAHEPVRRHGRQGITPIETRPRPERSFYAADPFDNPLSFVDSKMLFTRRTDWPDEWQRACSGSARSTGGAT